MQQSIKDQKSRHVVAGPVLITKNPCVHPGDVRKVSTLTHEKDPERFNQMSHLYNVIVFSTKGTRPLQNMMSAGDLDGDVYMVIWDEQLVNAVKNVEQPASPESVVQIRQDNAQLDGFYDHLTHYMKNDTLGELSNLHVAMCDQSPEGPKGKEAMEVAAMISVQVDFAKHSECITKESFEAIKRKVTKYPDYLQSKSKTTASQREIYESTHVLGHMYRHINIKDFYEMCTRTEYNQSIKYDYQIRPLLQSYFRDAAEFGDSNGKGIGLENHFVNL